MSPNSSSDMAYYHNDVYGSKLLVKIFGSLLHGRVLEVGAGAGHVTIELAKRSKQVVAVEPTPSLFTELRERTLPLSNVSVIHGTLRDYVQREKASSDASNSLFDAIVYVNVLEHIEDDVTELSLAKELLRPSGFVIIVVPAHQWLYARVDQLTGHFRRYSKRTMTNVVSSSGLTLHSLRYFDSVGLVPYLVLYKWLRNVSTSGTNATIYSRVIMPISYMIFVLFRGRLLGKNLVAIAGASAAG